MSDVPAIIAAYDEAAQILDRGDVVEAAKALARANALFATVSALDRGDLDKLRTLHHHCTVTAGALQKKLQDDFSNAGRGRKATRAYRR